MHPQARLFSILAICCLLFAPLLRAQENPLNDPDLKEMLKEAQEMQKEATELQKQNPTSPDTKKKLAEMLSQAKEEEARQQEQEKREKEKVQTALKKQLEAPGPIVLPDWTPATPEFTAAGAAATAANNLNQSLNKINVNVKITRILFLSARTDPRQEVELEASREPDSKITQVEISSPLPKPNIESE